MSNSWKTTTIKDACEQMNGIWKGAKPPFTTAKILRTTNFSKDCKMKLDDLAIIEVEEKKLNARRLKRGDIIVEKSGGGPKQPVGRVILFDIDDEDFSFCNFTSTLRVKNQSEILPEYLHKYLTFLYFEGETEKYQSNLVGFRNLDFKGYVSMSFRYPELSEQQRIVSLLDAEFAKIDTLKANAERNLQNAKDLFQAALKDVFLSIQKTKKLDDIVTIINGFAFKSEDFKKDNPIKAIKITNVGVGHFVETADTNLPLAIWESKPEFQVKEGDIIFALTRTIISDGLKVAIVPKSYDKALLNQRVAALSINNSALRNYLFYYFQTPMVKQYVLAHVNTLMQPNLSINDLRAMPIKIVDDGLMLGTVARLDALNEKCKTLQSNYEKTIALCDNLKQALLRKAFNGEI